MTTRREAIRTIAVAGGVWLIGCDDTPTSPDGGTGLDAATPQDAGLPHDAFVASGDDAAAAAADAGPPESDAGPTFVLGETKPTSANTGLNVEGVAESELTVVSGNVTHSMDDAVFDRIRFTGRVSISAKRITYRNCWFNAPHTAGQALVQCSNQSCEDIVFENCLFLPSSYSATAEGALANCLFGHQFRIYRCDLSGGVDIIGLYSGVRTEPARNVELLGSYLHDMTYYSPESGQRDNQTHNDAVQVHRGAARLRVFGCSIEATIDPAQGQASDPPVTSPEGAHLSGNKYHPGLFAMSGFMFSPVDLTAGVEDIEIDRNWLSTGQVHINWPRQDGVNVRITNNRWGEAPRLSSGGNPTFILMQRAQAATITGNVFEATGEPYDRRMNGD